MAAGQETAPEAAAALTELCQAYWPPLYPFVRRRGFSVHDAQDLTQGFFVHLLESNAHGQAEPTRGKFRTFLLAMLKNFLTNEWDKQRCIKRGGGYTFSALGADRGRRIAVARRGRLFDAGKVVRPPMGGDHFRARAD